MNDINDLMTYKTRALLNSLNISYSAFKVNQIVNPRTDKIGTWIGVDVNLPVELAGKTNLELFNLYTDELKKNNKSYFFGSSNAKSDKKPLEQTQDSEAYYFVGVDIKQTKSRLEYVVSDTDISNDIATHGFMVISSSDIHTYENNSPCVNNDKNDYPLIAKEIAKKQLDIYNACESGHVYNLTMRTLNNDIVIDTFSNIAIDNMLDTHFLFMLKLLMRKIKSQSDAVQLQVGVVMVGDYDSYTAIDLVEHINDSVAAVFDAHLVYGDYQWNSDNDELSLIFLTSSLPKFSELNKNRYVDLVGLIKENIEFLVNSNGFDDVDKWELVDTLMNKDDYNDWSPLLFNALIRSMISVVEGGFMVGVVEPIKD